MIQSERMHFVANLFSVSNSILFFSFFFTNSFTRKAKIAIVFAGENTQYALKKFANAFTDTTLYF